MDVIFRRDSSHNLLPQWRHHNDLRFTSSQCSMAHTCSTLITSIFKSFHFKLILILHLIPKFVFKVKENSGQFNLRCSHNQGMTFVIGQHKVTYVVMDGAEYETECSFRVVIETSSGGLWINKLEIKWIFNVSIILLLLLLLLSLLLTLLLSL